MELFCDNVYMTKNIRLHLGKKIKSLRISRNLTQDKLAEIAGINYKYLQKIESKYSPDLKLETVQKLAKALKTTPSDLLDV